MRRRPFDNRRPARRPYLDRACLGLVAAVLAVLLLVAVLSREKLPISTPPSIRKNLERPSINEDLNITDDKLSPYSIMRQMEDQISLAKALVVISKDSNNAQFAAELSAQILKNQALLSSFPTERAALTTKEYEMAIRDMALLLYQAQQLHYDSATMIVKMKGQFQALNEKMKSETEKSSKYGQIAAGELPKGLYCLGVRLALEWFGNPNLQRKLSEGMHNLEKLGDNSLYHYCIFSDNTIAASVVVNSTIVNSKHPDMIVFHLVTDEVNYAPMKAWFSMNRFGSATIEVQMLEDFSWLDASNIPVLKQIQNSQTQKYFSGSTDNRAPSKFWDPKHQTLMLNHLRFYIPEVYPTLEKVVFLDDDVVVQKDLTELFSIDLHGNVMGAVDTCNETFHGFHKLLNYSHPLIRSHFDPDACGWAFGLNVMNLREWKRKYVTGKYHTWLELNADHTLWKQGILPPALLAFSGLVQNLDAKWHVRGLGDTDVDPLVLKDAAVLHYNGNMKPWLKIGKEKYKGIWEKYVDYSHPIMQQCFMHG